MKRLIMSGIVMILTLATSIAATDNKQNRNNPSDSIKYVEINGMISDAESGEPLVFASVVVTGTSVATVTNTDGEFVLKVPTSKKNGTLSITHLGYENAELEIPMLLNKENSITLHTITLPIDEVIIRSIDPVSLLMTALDKVPSNYTNVPEMQTSFYRETIKQNRNYVSVSEAVMDIYKAPYKTSFDFDRLRIYKGRKSTDVKKMDTLLVKLQGGPKTSLLLDVVKNPGDILDRESFDYYNFELTGVTSINNRETYVIKFDQKDGIEFPLYSGNIYIDTETKAFVGLDFSLSQKGLAYASRYLVKKKPANLNINVEKGHYLVKYRLENNEWYLNYVRSELALEAKWKKKLFKSDIGIMLEMAVTDRGKENIEKFPVKESAKMNDIFAEQVSFFEDEDFWGEYNTIKPDESIEVAIAKLNKKLKRRQ